MLRIWPVVGRCCHLSRCYPIENVHFCHRILHKPHMSVDRCLSVFMSCWLMVPSISIDRYYCWTNYKFIVNYYWTWKRCAPRCTQYIVVFIAVLLCCCCLIFVGIQRHQKDKMSWSKTPHIERNENNGPSTSINKRRLILIATPNNSIRKIRQYSRTNGSDGVVCNVAPPME